MAIFCYNKSHSDYKEIKKRLNVEEDHIVSAFIDSAGGSMSEALKRLDERDNQFDFEKHVSKESFDVFNLLKNTLNIPLDIRSSIKEYELSLEQKGKSKYLAIPSSAVKINKSLKNDKKLVAILSYLIDKDSVLDYIKSTGKNVNTKLEDDIISFIENDENANKRFLAKVKLHIEAELKSKDLVPEDYDVSSKSLIEISRDIKRYDIEKKYENLTDKDLSFIEGRTVKTYLYINEKIIQTDLNPKSFLKISKSISNFAKRYIYENDEITIDSAIENGFRYFLIISAIRTSSIYYDILLSTIPSHLIFVKSSITERYKKIVPKEVQDYNRNAFISTAKKILESELRTLNLDSINSEEIFNSDQSEIDRNNFIDATKINPKNKIRLKTELYLSSLPLVSTNGISLLDENGLPVMLNPVSALYSIVKFVHNSRIYFNESDNTVEGAREFLEQLENSGDINLRTIGTKAKFLNDDKVLDIVNSLKVLSDNILIDYGITVLNEGNVYSKTGRPETVDYTDLAIDTALMISNEIINNEGVINLNEFYRLLSDRVYFRQRFGTPLRNRGFDDSHIEKIHRSLVSRIGLALEDMLKIKKKKVEGKMLNDNDVITFVKNLYEASRNKTGFVNNKEQYQQFTKRIAALTKLVKEDYKNDVDKFTHDLLYKNFVEKVLDKKNIEDAFGGRINIFVIDSDIFRDIMKKDEFKNRKSMSVTPEDLSVRTRTGEQYYRLIDNSQATKIVRDLKVFKKILGRDVYDIYSGDDIVTNVSSDILMKFAKYPELAYLAKPNILNIPFVRKYLTNINSNEIDVQIVTHIEKGNKVKKFNDINEDEKYVLDLTMALEDLSRPYFSSPIQFERSREFYFSISLEEKMGYIGYDDKKSSYNRYFSEMLSLLSIELFYIAQSNLESVRKSKEIIEYGNKLRVFDFIYGYTGKNKELDNKLKLLMNFVEGLSKEDGANPEYVYQKIVDKIKSDEYRNLFYQVFDSFLNYNTAINERELKNRGILDNPGVKNLLEEADPLLSPYGGKGDLRRGLANYIAGSMIFKMSYLILTIGDVATLSKKGDIVGSILKRLSQTTSTKKFLQSRFSPKQVLEGENKLKYNNAIVKNEDENDTVSIKDPSIIRVLPIKDVFKEARNIEGIEKVFKEYLKKQGYYDDEVGDLTPEGKIYLNDFINPYKEITEADGAGYVNIKLYKSILNAVSLLTPKMEEVIDKVERIYNGSDEVLAIDEIKVLKPLKTNYVGQVYQQQETQYTPYYTTNLKHALFPIIPGVHDDSMIDFVNRNDIDILQFNSGIKWGIPFNGRRGDLLIAFDKEGKFNVELGDINDSKEDPTNKFYEEDIMNISFHNFGLQQNTLGKEKEEAIGSQITKIILTNTAENGNVLPEAKEAVESYFKAKDNFVEEGINKLREEAGIVIEGEDKIVKIEDFTKLKKFLLNRIGFNLESLKFAEMLKNIFNEEAFLEQYSNSITFQHTVNKIINDYTARRRVKGSALFQMPITFVKDNIEGSNELKFYEIDENGTVVSPMEVMIPVPKHIYTYYNGDMDAINNALQNGEFDAYNEIVGFRIPTQGLGSVEYIKVKKFLPPSVGSAIIVPTELIAKAGSDFDIDKIYLFIKEDKINVEVLNKKKLLKDVNDYLDRKDINYDYNTGEIISIVERGLRDDEYLSEEERDIFDIAKKYVSIKVVNKQKSATNDLIDSYIKLIKIPGRGAELLRPVGLTTIKTEKGNSDFSIHDVLMKYKKSDWGGSSVTKMKTHKLLLPLENSSIFGVSRVAATGIGIAATHRVGHTMAQFASLAASVYPFNSNNNYSGIKTVNGVDISKIIEDFMSILVDAGKNPELIIDMNLNINMLKAVLTMVRAGVSTEAIGRLMANKHVVEFSKKYKAGSNFALGKGDSDVYNPIYALKFIVDELNMGNVNINGVPISKTLDRVRGSSDDEAVSALIDLSLDIKNEISGENISDIDKDYFTVASIIAYTIALNDSQELFKFDRYINIESKGLFDDLYSKISKNRSDNFLNDLNAFTENKGINLKQVEYINKLNNIARVTDSKYLKQSIINSINFIESLEIFDESYKFLNSNKRRRLIIDAANLAIKYSLLSQFNIQLDSNILDSEVSKKMEELLSKKYHAIGDYVGLEKGRVVKLSTGQEIIIPDVLYIKKKNMEQVDLEILKESMKLLKTNYKYKEVYDRMLQHGLMQNIIENNKYNILSKLFEKEEYEGKIKQAIVDFNNLEVEKLNEFKNLLLLSETFIMNYKSIFYDMIGLKSNRPMVYKLVDDNIVLVEHNNKIYVSPNYKNSFNSLKIVEYKKDQTSKC